MSKVIAIDFDNTIHNAKHPIKGKRMGEPIEGTQDALKRLKQLGHKIIIFTVWGGSEQGKKTIEDFMKYYDLPFDEITNIKPEANHYVDDKAVKFTNWTEVYKLIW